MNDAYDEIPLPSEPVLNEEETMRQLRQDQLRWVSDMLSTALDNRQIAHGPSIFEMINTLTKAVDDARSEVLAVHECWDNFVNTVSEAMPDLQRRPLFS